MNYATINALSPVVEPQCLRRFALQARKRYHHHTHTPHQHHNLVIFAEAIASRVELTSWRLEEQLPSKEGHFLGIKHANTSKSCATNKWKA